MPRILTNDERAEIQSALEDVQATQTAFWEALSALEGLLEGPAQDLSGDTDYEEYDVDTLLDMESEETA